MFKGYGNYDKYPKKNIGNYEAVEGYEKIVDVIKKRVGNQEKCVITLELYTSVDVEEILKGLKPLGATFFSSESCMVSDEEYYKAITPFLTDDRVFGIMNTLNIKDFYCEEKIKRLQAKINQSSGIVIVYGVGASLVTTGDILIYGNINRWEIQCRFEKGLNNWKSDNGKSPGLAKFKQGYFLEWRMADRIKKTLFDKIDYMLDTNIKMNPKLVTGNGYRKGLEKFATEPFRLVPYFAPGVWGGQWMKNVCGLEKKSPNYAWAFDGVPEENSIVMKFGEITVEVPAIDIILYTPINLLGTKVHARFGTEFPIRFDFLDTMEGQNLSLQVHPLTEYIQNTFNMHYTQDESYYILDCGDNSVVYLGLKEDINKDEMLNDLRIAQNGEIKFYAEKYVNTFDVKKHDHFLIPAGTVHCSGKDTMVLEISATPYIFTFKLWDWDRLGLDGLPRPVHIDHGEQVIQWDRTTRWVEKNLVNNINNIKNEDTIRIEKTGLHEREFIDTYRYNIKICHKFESNGSVSMCNVVEGEGAIIESVDNSFESFEVHYAETFIIPEAVKNFIIRPIGSEVTILRATVK